MRNLDILAAESGEHVRVLLCREEQSYGCQLPTLSDAVPRCIGFACRITARPCRNILVFVLDEDITNRQREGAQSQARPDCATVGGCLYL